MVMMAAVAAGLFLTATVCLRSWASSRFSRQRSHALSHFPTGLSSAYRRRFRKATDRDGEAHIRA
jgi:hypothetical protein